MACRVYSVGTWADYNPLAGLTRRTGFAPLAHYLLPWDVPIPADRLGMDPCAFGMEGHVGPCVCYYMWVWVWEYASDFIRRGSTCNVIEVLHLGVT